jgi:hypothetical protein
MEISSRGLNEWNETLIDDYGPVAAKALVSLAESIIMDADISGLADSREDFKKYLSKIADMSNRTSGEKPALNTCLDSRNFFECNRNGISSFIASASAEERGSLLDFLTRHGLISENDPFFTECGSEGRIVSFMYGKAAGIISDDMDNGRDFYSMVDVGSDRNVRKTYEFAWGGIADKLGWHLEPGGFAAGGKHRYFLDDSYLHIKHAAIEIDNASVKDFCADIKNAVISFDFDALAQNLSSGINDSGIVDSVVDLEKKRALSFVSDFADEYGILFGQSRPVKSGRAMDFRGKDGGKNNEKEIEK